MLRMIFHSFTRPMRERRAIKALQAVSDAKDACREAKVRGDTRGQHEAEGRLLEARTEQMRAELALLDTRHPRTRRPFA